MSNASTLVQRRPNENKLNYGKIQKKMTVRFQRLTDKDCIPSLGKEEIGIPCIEENSQLQE